MRKIMFMFCTAALMGILGAACGDIDELEQGPGRENYYWSGGEKIWLDTDFSLMIVGFDREESATAFIEAMPGETSRFRETTVWVYVRNKGIKEKVLADKSVTNKIYGHIFSGYDAPMRMTGEIVMQPKAGVSPQDIFKRFEVNGKIVKTTDTGIVTVMLNDWNKLLSTANAIYESGMVDWCHPDFWTPINMWP